MSTISPHGQLLKLGGDGIRTHIFLHAKQTLSLKLSYTPRRMMGFEPTHLLYENRQRLYLLSYILSGQRELNRNLRYPKPTRYQITPCPVHFRCDLYLQSTYPYNMNTSIANFLNKYFSESTSVIYIIRLK